MTTGVEVGALPSLQEALRDALSEVAGHITTDDAVSTEEKTDSAGTVS